MLQILKGRRDSHRAPTSSSKGYHCILGYHIPFPRTLDNVGSPFHRLWTELLGCTQTGLRQEAKLQLDPGIAY